MDSPFLEKTKLLENEFGFVVYDGFPVSKGYCLMVPHRVYSNYFEYTEDVKMGWLFSNLGRSLYTTSNTDL